MVSRESRNKEIELNTSARRSLHARITVNIVRHTRREFSPSSFCFSYVLFLDVSGRDSSTSSNEISRRVTDLAVHYGTPHRNLNGKSRAGKTIRVTVVNCRRDLTARR